VLNDHQDVDAALRDRVETAIRELGYRPDARAQSFGRERSRIVGLVLCNGAGVNSVHALLLLGIEGYCAQSGYYLLFARHQYESNAEAGDLQLPGLMQARGLVDCLIVTGTNYENFLEALDSIGLTYVALANHVVLNRPRASGKNQVRYNDLGGYAEATRYLIQLGHRHIWYIGDTSKPWYRNRYDGYAKAMAESGLEPHAQTIALADDAVENGHAAVAIIADQKLPMTAIVAGSDGIAHGVREGLRQRGREVPHDVSLIGFQHQIEQSRISNLTSVCVDAVEVGRQLAKTAITRIESNGKDLPEVIVPTVLVKRGTCRPLRGEEHMVL
jgi:DNA-binding LacI/PurR family transcriptional regulator